VNCYEGGNCTKKTALHMMEGQGDKAWGLTNDFWLANRANILDAIEAAGMQLMSNQKGFWLHPLIAPKTSFDHWVDEVEASGEAEKHAPKKRDPLREAAIIAIGALERIQHATVSDRTDAADALRDALAFTACSSSEQATMRYELNKFKTLYQLSQDGFTRERGITRELAALLREAYDAMPDGACGYDFYERADAALSKVQQ
jgi:hypothetical protein